MLEDLHVAYRPTDFDEVCGQREVVASLKAVLKKNANHSFLFHGPSGVGKTTLARILAAKLGCDPSNLVEVDAASHTGIDAMRDLTASMQYRPVGTTSTRVYIIDEAHALSRQAWQSLLKSVEEPPSHCYWVFCTTEPTKVPETIRNRCLVYKLNAVRTDDIFELLSDVNESEEMEVPEDVLNICAKHASGSPRLALTALSKVRGCASRKEAAALLAEVLEGDDAVLELCRGLASGKLDWKRAMKLVGDIGDVAPESVRLQVTGYFSKVAAGAASARAAGAALAVLEAFGQPYPPVNQLYPLMLSLGELLLDE